jgi:hypothetical protein
MYQSTDKLWRPVLVGECQALESGVAAPRRRADDRHAVVLL